VSSAFDPWTASIEQAEHAAKKRQPGQPDPVQQKLAAQEVLFARDMCHAAGGWWQVMHCVAICGKARLLLPGWLSDLFSATLIQVRESEHGSFDKIVGTLAKSKARENKARFRESQTKQIRQDGQKEAEHEDRRNLRDRGADGRDQCKRRHCQGKVLLVIAIATESAAFPARGEKHKRAGSGRLQFQIFRSNTKNRFPAASRRLRMKSDPHPKGYSIP
jgi:hypothetical protein